MSGRHLPAAHRASVASDERSPRYGQSAILVSGAAPKPFTAMPEQSRSLQLAARFLSSPSDVDAHPNAKLEFRTLASFSQRSMWAIAARHPKVRLNEMVIPWHIRGPLELAALRYALDALVARHVTLRSLLRYERGQLDQITLSTEPIPMEVIEVDGATPDERIEATLALINGRAGRAVDVIAGPPLHVQLFRLGDSDHVLCVRVHHAMCDGWSIGLMLHDLVALYVARRDGRPHGLPPLKMQQSDVAKWEFDTYASGGFETELRYWRAELADPPQPVCLPTIAPRKNNRDWNARLTRRSLPLETYAPLRDLARRLRVSRFSVLLAALCVMLRRHAASDDMLIGVPTLNRWSDDAMRVVGYATSLLPIRVRIDGDLPFSSLCARVHARTHEMLANGRVPYEVLLRETDLAKFDQALMPVWSQYFEQSSRRPYTVGGLEIRQLTTARCSMLAEFDLDLYGADDGLVCEFGYRTALFDPAWVDAFIEQYLSVLGVVPERPDGALRTL